MAGARFFEPMKCLPVGQLPAGAEWEYELKFDGYRALAIKKRSGVTLFSRNQKSFNARFPNLLTALEKLPDESIIDGEIVAVDGSGRPSFNLLQNHANNASSIRFFAFDIVMWKGKQLGGRPLDWRRDLLKTKVMPKLAGINYSETFDVTANEMLAAVRSQRLEGVIAKRRDSLYEPGERSGAWVKMRVRGGQEFVIGGYTPSPKNFDSLLVGYYEGESLIYAARVRNGFVPSVREQLFRVVKNVRRGPCPFTNLPELKKGRWGEGLTAADMAKCTWLQPELVAAIEYVEWTPANHLRHSAFIALRDDKDPRQVVRERS
jgi:DNA ligase D-like protein (predicted ligase)